MKFVKGISLFFLYPLFMFGLGVYVGVQTTHFFYPGTSLQQEMQVRELKQKQVVETVEEPVIETEPLPVEETAQVNASGETLCVDTEYVLEETDIVTGSVVETVGKLPDKYIGLDREQFINAMKNYELFPPLSELERGFVSLEVRSFSRERVVVQMNYQYVQPSTSFYLAIKDNEVVVYLEDKETIYIHTGIDVSTLPEDLRMELIQMYWVESEENLYDFLETYSS